MIDLDAIVVEQTENSVAVLIELHHDQFFFRGHFDSQPILPGVAQLHWAIEAAQRFLAVRGPFRSVRNLKFRRVLVPPNTVRLSLSRLATAGEFRFSYSIGAQEYSTGQLRFDVA